MTFQEMTSKCFNDFEFRHTYQVQRAGNNPRLLYYGKANDERIPEYNHVRDREVDSWLIDFKNRLVVVMVK